MSRRGGLSTLLVIGCACVLAAQEQLPVDIDDPVYPLLEISAIRGLVAPGSMVKPYSEREIRSRLDAARGGERPLSQDERSVLDEMARRFPKGDAPVAYLEAAGQSGLRADLSRAGVLDFSLSGEVGILGSLWSIASYRLRLEGMLDMADPEAFAPYDFTKQWDGFQVWTEGSKVQTSNGINGHLNFASAASSALSFDFFDHALNLQFTRTRRDWGVGEGSLSLSGTARPIEAFSASARPASWASFHFLAGSLGDWWSPAAEQKMFSLHRIEFFPLDWLYISPWESVVYAKRLELSYLNPLMPFFFGQQLSGDYDNIAMGGDVAVTIAPFARVYFSLFVDEISFVPLSTFFSRPGNQYAWQIGVKVPLPWPAWALFTFQYTKIEPYTYTHYLQAVPQYGTQLIDTSYSNDGENIGYHLPPNSDEFLVRLSAYPAPRLSVTAQYQLIRHGTGQPPAGPDRGGYQHPDRLRPPHHVSVEGFPQRRHLRVDSHCPPRPRLFVPGPPCLRVGGICPCVCFRLQEHPGKKRAEESRRHRREVPGCDLVRWRVGGIRAVRTPMPRRQNPAGRCGIQSNPGRGRA